MPFTKTKSASESEWTWIYENLIKKAVEGAGLDFQCERSKATRGNILKKIIHSLNECDVVIADLTDHNPNVCYELGIRHGLRPGTILLAQDRDFLRIFDLQSYASHVYEWESEKGKKQLMHQIQKLLIDFLQNPTEADNPVHDFLKEKPSFRNASATELEGIVEIDDMNEPHLVIAPKQISASNAIGFLLLTTGEIGLTMNELTELVSKNWKKQKANQISSTIASMKGLVVTIGTKGNYRYRLSGKGREEMLKIVKILKQN